MSLGNGTPREIDPQILREAADWLMRLHAGAADPAAWAAVERWRATSAQHRQAWQRAEALLGDLQRIPPALARIITLERPHARRRQLLRLAWLPLLPAAWVGWRQLDASGGERWASATGEQRALTLADGTQILLNTASEISVRFDAERRLIHLAAGEILVDSAPDPAPRRRPLVVETADGSVRALGTRFTVRRLAHDSEARSHVAVFAGAVEIETATSRQRRRLERDEQSEFAATRLGPVASAESAVVGAWASGMIVARQMRLAELVAELDRYRPGLLRCHPLLAELRVSGAFPALDPERSLRLLAASFPVRVHYRSRYWVTVEPA